MKKEMKKDVLIDSEVLESLLNDISALGACQKSQEPQLFIYRLWSYCISMTS